MGMVKESGNSKRNDRRNSWGEEEEAERTLTKSSRPPLEKQSSLNTTEAYREVCMCVYFSEYASTPNFGLTHFLKWQTDCKKKKKAEQKN